MKDVLQDFPKYKTLGFLMIPFDGCMLLYSRSKYEYVTQYIIKPG